MLRPALPSTIAIKEHFDQCPLFILADPIKVHQVIMNLCTNAFQAMEQTGGVLDIGLHECTLTRQDLLQDQGVQPGAFVVVSVRDTGQGIPKSILTKIFDPYFTTKEVGKGTGMGLAIVHGIVSSCGGFVTCTSDPGNGATFKVHFPMYAQPIVHRDNHLEPVPTGNEHILFIDDEKLLADMNKVMLNRLGYTVTACTNSLEALHLFQANPDRFDAIITDQTMPGLTGIELAGRILNLRPNIPIILCTGYSSLVDETLAKSCGIKGFAMKPVVKKDIALLLREILDNTERPL